LIRAFFVGRATAGGLLEKLEDAVTDLLSEVGKREADWRDQLREFTEAVITRADAEQAEAMADLSSESRSYATSRMATADVQRTVDELRAEVARLRSELQRFRNQESL
jgi:polyhydroxyalkanoate synthesis regulator phasin